VKKFDRLSIALVGALLAGCASNGNAITPDVSKVNLQNTTALQIAVGTANIGTTGTVGLNVVATFRQQNGDTAALVNTPTITGPPGFVVPATAPSSDAGTGHISAAPQNANPNIPNPATTFGQSGGVYSYGLDPFNLTTSGAPRYPGNPGVYALPFYSGSTSTAVNLRYVGGPPAYAFFNDGTYPPFFAGYSQGFTTFNAAPVTGAYALSVSVGGGNSNTPAQTFSASANLTDLAPLPALPAPAFVADGAGGGSGTIAVPADPRIVETMVYFVDRVTGLYFAAGPLQGTGTLSFSLPDSLGACAGSGCQTGSKATPSIGTGDAYRVYAASYDYPAFEASPPASKLEKPIIAASNGQADVTTSAPFSSTY
jgi:hypothetical protein